MTVNLNKNKRPSGRLVEDIEMEMDLDTGVLTPLDGDLPRQYRHRHLRALCMNRCPHCERWHHNADTDGLRRLLDHVDDTSPRSKGGTTIGSEYEPPIDHLFDRMEDR